MNNLTYSSFKSLSQSQHQKRSWFYSNNKCFALERDEFSQENLSIVWNGWFSLGAVFSGLFFWAESVKALLYRQLI